MAQCNDLAAAALQKLQVGVMLVDAELRLCLVNSWLRHTLRNPPDEPHGLALLEVFPALHGSRLLRAIKQALEQGLPSVLSPGLNPHPLPLFAADDSAIAQSIHVMQVREQGRIFCVVCIQDVSASMRREALLREQADKLNSLSLTDELTGVANRRRLNMYLDEELRRAERSAQALSVILLDIDHFKGYNDHFGHLAGDDCLVRISRSSQALVNRAGDLFARYGGEEFCVVLANTDSHGARAFAEELRTQIEALALPHPGNSTGPVVTISLGIASCGPGSHDSPTGLLLKADRALYRAKQQGRNASVCHLGPKV